MTIQESRYITITDKIIKEKDVQKLAKAIDTLSKRRRKDGSYTSTYSVKCEEDASFSSNDVSIFANESPIQSKRIIEIRMNFSRHFSDERVSIILRHGNPYLKSDNSITVEGDDPNWVNGTLKKLEEIVDGFEPQNTFVKKYGKYIFALYSFVFSFVSVNIVLELIIKYEFHQLEFPTGSFLSFWLFPLMILGVIVFLLTIPVIKLWIYVEKLFPSVELQIGSEYKFIEKNKRFWINTSLAVIVVPIILQIIFEVVKSLL